MSAIIGTDGQQGSEVAVSAPGHTPAGSRTVTTFTAFSTGAKIFQNTCRLPCPLGKVPPRSLPAPGLGDCLAWHPSRPLAGHGCAPWLLGTTQPCHARALLFSKHRLFLRVTSCRADAVNPAPKWSAPFAQCLELPGPLTFQNSVTLRAVSTLPWLARSQ